MNEMLLITNDNRIYVIEDENEKMNLLNDKHLTDDQIIKICSEFVETNRARASQKKLVATMTLSDKGQQLSLEPLRSKGEESTKIQGELPIEYFIRSGRKLGLNDLKSIINRLRS